MPGPTLEMEPVEPQSLKKLSFKSLKRALDLFSPVHGRLAAPDSQRFLSLSIFIYFTYFSLSQIRFFDNFFPFFFFPPFSVAVRRFVSVTRLAD